MILDGGAGVVGLDVGGVDTGGVVVGGVVGGVVVPFPLPLPGTSQLPKPAWHPAPQWSAVLPHQPWAEQHVPNLEPVQVMPLPHVPSGLTVPPVAGGGVGEAPLPLLVVVAGLLPLLVLTDDGGVTEEGTGDTGCASASMQ